jgi:hypothetical protein
MSARGAGTFLSLASGGPRRYGILPIMVCMSAAENARSVSVRMFLNALMLNESAGGHIISCARSGNKGSPPLAAGILYWKQNTLLKNVRSKNFDSDLGRFPWLVWKNVLPRRCCVEFSHGLYDFCNTDAGAHTFRECAIMEPGVITGN